MVVECHWPKSSCMDDHRRANCFLSLNRHRRSTEEAAKMFRIGLNNNQRIRPLGKTYPLMKLHADNMYKDNPIFLPVER